MRKGITILLILIVAISSITAKNYISITAAPYFDGGNIIWGKGGDVENVKYKEMGAEINIDFAFNRKVFFDFLRGGIAFGTGVQIPISREQSGEQYLYSYALTPYLATTIGFEINEKCYLDIAGGWALTIGKDFSKDVERSLYIDYCQFYLALSFLYNFTDHIALRAGVSGTLNPALPIFAIYEKDGSQHFAGLASMDYSVEPNIGVAFTF